MPFWGFALMMLFDEWCFPCDMLWRPLKELWEMLFTRASTQCPIFITHTSYIRRRARAAKMPSRYLSSEISNNALWAFELNDDTLRHLFTFPFDLSPAYYYASMVITFHHAVNTMMIAMHYWAIDILADSAIVYLLCTQRAGITSILCRRLFCALLAI